MQKNGKAMSKYSPGLEDFQAIGQRVDTDGDVPTATLSAHITFQLICHKDGKSFATLVA